jgi:hypothetical protein
MCEWIICMWQNNSHEKTQFITESHFNFHIHLRRSYVCRIYLHSFHLINLFHMQFVTCPD